MWVPAITIIIVIFAIVLVCFYTYFHTKNAQKEVLTIYSRLDTYLSKRYELISQILKKLSGENFISAGEKIKSLQDEVISLGILPQNIDRRAAFDGEITIKMNELINMLETSFGSFLDSSIVECIQKYRSLDVAIGKIIGKYNHAAHKLKIVTEVFPSSFAARLIGVKSIDLYREV